MACDEQQRIVVFQQHASGAGKIRGIRLYGGGQFKIQTISIDDDLPPILDETDRYFPKTLYADLVLNYLNHPDLSCDLVEKCIAQGIPVVVPGKKGGLKGVYTAPT
ncbi:protein of unknown function DUF166 [Desulfococcus multivorans DSM 2059]|jgi:hypothetical protein|uniref:Uncharacterized protein n=2 Tax=Desulfococcaceae TaxID=2931039 RepID=S7TBZ4_DESML|nr:uncharacterized protein, DUF166 [Desulfococcus multivorans]EPR34687.1 protein of unknown function DUF166 [Desulfococcus multivorans DSM 2059]SKA02931.1 protein of unknown function [Desulfococcus multivorans DSM 2059]